MFTKPIKRTRLNSMEELFKFSYRTDQVSEKKLIINQNNGQIAFSDELGRVWVTPYRTEIYDVLFRADYELGSMSVPFSSDGEIPEAYSWLKKIAERENWAETYEKAFKYSQEIGITPIEFDPKIQMRVREITTWVESEEDDKMCYRPMVDKFLLNQNNVGTYIIIDDKSILVCDEYGRTYLIIVKTVINDVVNTLIDAGYRHTEHPEYYVQKRNED